MIDKATTRELYNVHKLNATVNERNNKKINIKQDEIVDTMTALLVAEKLKGWKGALKDIC